MITLEFPARSGHSSLHMAFFWCYGAIVGTAPLSRRGSLIRLAMALWPIAVSKPQATIDNGAMGDFVPPNLQAEMSDRWERFLANAACAMRRSRTWRGCWKPTSLPIAAITTWRTSGTAFPNWIACATFCPEVPRRRGGYLVS